MVKMNIHIQDELAADIRRKARVPGRSVSAYIREILEAETRAKPPVRPTDPSA